MSHIIPMPIDEISIFSEVRVIHQKDLNQVNSTENISVTFELSGQVKGKIFCYLVLDLMELNDSEKQLIYPLFMESMNILIGQQISTDTKLRKLNIHLSAPKPSIISQPVYSKLKNQTQLYEIQMNNMELDVLVNYSLEVLN